MNSDFPYRGGGRTHSEKKPPELGNFWPEGVFPSDRYIPLRTGHGPSFFPFLSPEPARTPDARHFSSVLISDLNIESLFGKRRSVLSFSRCHTPENASLKSFDIGQGTPSHIDFAVAEGTPPQAPPAPWKEFNTQPLSEKMGVEHLDWSGKQQLAFVLEKKVVFYEEKKMEKISTMEHNGDVASIRFCPVGEKLALLEATGKVQIYDTARHELTQEHRAFVGSGVSLRWMNPFVAMCVSQQGFFTQFDLRCRPIEANKNKYSLINSFKEVLAFDFNPLNTRAVFGTSDGCIMVRDLRFFDSIDATIRAHKTETTRVCFNPVQPGLVVSLSGPKEKQMALTSVYNTSVLKKVSLGSPAREIRFSQRDEVFLVGHFGKSYHYSIGVWSRDCKILSKLEPLEARAVPKAEDPILTETPPENPLNEVINIAFSPNCNEFAVSYASHKIKLWKTSDLICRNEHKHELLALPKPR